MVQKNSNELFANPIFQVTQMLKMTGIIGNLHGNECGMDETKRSREKDKPHLTQKCEARWTRMVYWPWNQRDSDVLKWCVLQLYVKFLPKVTEITKEMTLVLLSSFAGKV